MPPFFRLFLPIAALFLVLGAARPATAEDLALVLTDSTALSDAAEAHRARVRAYRDAGYRTEEGFDLTREQAARLLASFERRLEDGDRVILHLTGRMEASAGVSVYLPRGATDDTRTAILTGGIPLALVMDMAAARPGQSVVALGRAAPAGAERLPLVVPQGVLLVRGAPAPVSSVVTGVMVGAGLPPTAIDATAAGVSFEGLVTDRLRLGADGTRLFRRPPPPEIPETASAARREAALGLTATERREIQRDLNLLGFNTRGVDGIFGPGTRAAIRAWERSVGLRDDGYLTATEIRALSRAAAEARAADTGRDRADREAWETARAADTIAGYEDYLDRYPDGNYVDRARERIDALERESGEAAERTRLQAQERALGLNTGSLLLVETRLGMLGYDPGTIDGRIDERTRSAIANFQHDRGLTPTGYLNGATVQRLVMGGN